MNRPERYVLLNPGPVTLTDSVRESMTGRDMCHREEDFSRLMSEVRSSLCEVYDLSTNDWTSILVTGSGTAAVEAMVSSLVDGPQTALVAANGVYGERIAAMLQRAGKQGVVARSDWQDPIDFDMLEKYLKSTPTIRHVIVVQHETTTGRLNDLDRVAGLCKQYGVRMLVDAVSSFGGVRVDFETWPLDAVAATANKCLHGVPGIAFVVARRELLTDRTTTASSLYLDLSTNFTAQEHGFPAFTPGIPSIYALRQAICELAQSGGWRQRADVYRRRTERVTEALAKLGISPLLGSPADRCSVLTAYRLPEGTTYLSISAPLRQRKIVIYAGQKQLEQVIFRIAVMGDLHEEDLDTLISTLASVCNR